MGYTVAKAPCGSCPYRRDVPSGIWERVEYDKLPKYDGEIIDQMMADATGLFLCHQQDGNLCAGWLACHRSDNLAAMRLHAAEVDPMVWSYETACPLWSSGAEARAHGIKDIAEPSAAARKKIDGLMSRQNRKSR